ncbi:hypothetical protein IPL85_01645 [Candidatus Saccharibacteria bacterium]|nr:MAG: hypothetical protein IPL85_01645 [Candidatus Saccharibacteria bacterium]
MDKSKLHHVWRYLKHVHPWYFLVIAMLFGFIAVKALQHNNIEMGRLRDAVFVADKNNGDVEAALRALREHVHGHMNTSLETGTNGAHPPIQLKYTYERLQAEQQAQLGQNNSSLYNQALQECSSQGQTATAQDTINCIESYTEARGVRLADIPDALYKFDFVSAKWSSDLAGWSLVVAVLSTIGFLVSVVYHWLIKKYLG